MKRWSDLVATALLGTSRAPYPLVPTAETPLDALLDQLQRETPERFLLASAGLLSLWGQAGAQPAPARGLLPTPAPSEGLPGCPPRAAQHLGEILQGEMGAALEEWLMALAAAGRALPHRWLPELLDLARQKGELRPLVLPLLGERGRWLAAQHSEWQQLLVPQDVAAQDECWQTGGRQIRLALLQQLRATDPARARDLLAATWTEESYRDRAAFLSTWSAGLGPDDEPFLERALDDSRKEVRAVAADLLARLPSSGLVRRTEAGLGPLLDLDRRTLGRGRLRVSLPERCDRAMVRDGVSRRPPAGLGQRAWWLLQMLAVVPLSSWSRRWSISPDDLVVLAYKTEYEAVLLEGWSRAAARQGEGGWAEALLRRWTAEPWSVLPSRKPLYFTDDLPSLVLAVPQERLESWLISLLRAHRRALEEHHTLLTLLQQHRRPWGEGLTRAVLAGLRPMADKPSYPVWRWRAALLGFARYAAPALADAAAKGWPAESTWRENVDRFLAILRFRWEMWAAFGVIS